MNKERLMTVLIQPHVSEKAATVTEKANQYVFRVRDDASKAEVKQAVELMFEVKVEGVNLLNRRARRAASRTCRQAQRLQESLCSFANRSVDRLHRQQRSKEQAMALIKMKPTSPGTRFVVKIDRSHLHKGGPLESLTTKKNRTGARNHSGRQTTRHIGGGHKQRYRWSISSATRTAFPARWSGSNTIRTAPRTWRWCCTRTASAATSSRRRA
jgi:ribosomal protein L23